MAFTVTTGAASGGSTTSPRTVPTPLGSNPPAGQLLVAVLEVGAASAVSSSGWTQLFLHSQAAATGNTILVVMAKLAAGSEGASQSFAATGTVNHMSGRMTGISGHGVSNVATDLVVGAFASGAASGSDPQVVTGIPSINVTAGSLIAIIGGTGLDATSTTNFSAYNNTDPGSGAAWTEQMDDVVISGNGGGFCCATGVCAGTSTGTAGFTMATNYAWNGMQLGIPPAGVAGVSDAIPRDRTNHVVQRDFDAWSATGWL